MEARNLIPVVIIDDNPRSLEFIATALREYPIEAFTASTPEEGLDLVYTHRPQLVMTDLVMPQMSGMEVLEHVIDFDPAIDVILMTAHYTTETAVEAIRKGAADYLNKPISLATLRQRVGRIIQAAVKRMQVRSAENQAMEMAQFEGMVGRSPQMWELFSRIQRVAAHYRVALITGKTGTGKELVAQALHSLSPVHGRFVVLNCSAVVETLFESELFGHVKGAFTGADRDKPGLFEYANGGTLFLDEIGDMPLATQAKLLRVLQNHEVQRVGSLTTQKIDVRIAAATNKNLRKAIAERHFREDLYFRLSMVEIHVPSLAERMEDVPLLVQHFVKKFSQQYSKNIRGLTQRAQIMVGRYSWPGNVRELENAIGHGCMMTFNDQVDAADLPSLAIDLSKDSAASPEAASVPSLQSTIQSLEENEKKLVIEALGQAAGNQSHAARTLRIGRDALRYKMKKFGLL